MNRVLAVLALVAALALTAQAEWTLALAVGWHPFVAWAGPVALDSYVVAAFRARRDRAWALGLMSAAVFSAHAVPVAFPTGLPWSIAGFCSIVPPLVAWRVHELWLAPRSIEAPPIVESIPVDPQSLAESTPTDRPPIEGSTDRVDPPTDRPQPIEAIEGRSTPTATPIDRGQLTPTAIRSMGQLRAELELAVEANSVDPNSAESIRKVLGVGLQRARALRDERAAKPPAADDEEESRSG